MSDSQSRKWQVTINNPIDHGFTHDSINNIMHESTNVVYYCLCDEIGLEDETYHTHIYIVFSSGVRFTTMKKRFAGGHLEMARGTNLENYNYIRKLGKYANDKKSDTNLAETFEEFGELPIDQQGARNDLTNLYDMVYQGLSNFEIISQYPQYCVRIADIDKMRQTILYDRFRKTFRKLEVVYIWGQAGSGKTRSVMEKFGYENVYRVTDYKHPFDGYEYQDVIVFEEFRGSNVKIENMLNYLDGYPLELPARFNNKVACFTKVFLITNVDLIDQYQGVQKDYPETWQAFLRRIHRIRHYANGRVHEAINGYKEYQLCFDDFER